MEKTDFKIKFILFPLILILSIISFNNFVYSESDTEFCIKASNHFLTLYLTEPEKFNFKEAPIEKALIQEIENAKETITILSFDFDNANLVEALLNASFKGVKIKIICDLKNTPTEVLNIFNSQNWLIYYKSNKLMHHKIIIFDKKIICLGSMNFTVSCMYANNNDFYFIRNEKISEKIKKYFDYLAYNQYKEILKEPVAIDGITFYFANSPYYNINDYIIKKINQAKKRIVFAYSTFTNDKVAKEIVKNVDDKKLFFLGLLEKRNAYSKYSAYSTFLNNNYHIYLDRNDYYMHHKLLIVDNFVITGSYAISDRTNTEKSIEFNDDLSFEFEDKKIADFLVEYIKKLIIK